MINLKIDAPQLETRASNPFYRFYLTYTGRLMPEMDNYNRNLARRLTISARQKLEKGARRPQEQGSRPKARLTGKLSPAITGSALGTGVGTGSTGSKVGRGVGWPNTTTLNRRARHWRTVEFGRTGVVLPQGVWVPGSGGDVYYTYRDFVRSRGLSPSRLNKRKASARARTNAVKEAGGKFQRETTANIEGRFFLRETWDEIVGPNGEHVGNDYARIIRDTFSSF